MRRSRGLGPRAPAAVRVAGRLTLSALVALGLLAALGSSAARAAPINLPPCLIAGTCHLVPVQPPPQVTGVGPTSGPPTGPTTLTVTGSGLTGATAVTLQLNTAYGTAQQTGCPASQVLTPVTVVSDSEVQVPAEGDGGVDVCAYFVTVTTPAGTSAVSAYSAAVFTYLVLGPAPVVTAVRPGTGPAAGGTSVTIQGINFAVAGGVTGVDFGTTPATSFQVNGDGSVSAVAPAGAAGATVRVAVTTPAGQSLVNPNGGDTFTYTAAPAVPAVTGISPSQGPPPGGTTVVITGTGFRADMAVVFGAGHPALSTAWNSPTQMTAVSPAGTGSVDVLVGDAAGSSAAVAADRFSYVPTWPPAPTGLAQTGDNPSGMTPDVILTWNPVGWMQVDNPNDNPANPGVPNACSEADTYDVQISTDPSFPTGAGTTLDSLPVGPQTQLPGMSSTPQCSGHSGHVTWSGGAFDLAWGLVASPSAYSGGQMLYARVRSEFYGEVGPWSAATSFAPPQPAQTFNVGTDVCGVSTTNFWTGDINGQSTFSCVQWLPVENAIGYDVRVVPRSAVPSGWSFPTNTYNVPDNLGSRGTIGNAANGGGAEQYCGSESWPSNTNPYCSDVPAALAPGETFVWDVRARYPSGQHGPWSVDFAGIWPAATSSSSTPTQDAPTAIMLQMGLFSLAPGCNNQATYNCPFNASSPLTWIAGVRVGDLPSGYGDDPGPSDGGADDQGKACVLDSPTLGTVPTWLAAACSVKATQIPFTTQTDSSGDVWASWLPTKLREGLWRFYFQVQDSKSHAAAWAWAVCAVPVVSPPSTFQGVLANKLVLALLSGGYWDTAYTPSLGYAPFVSTIPYGPGGMLPPAQAVPFAPGLSPDPCGPVPAPPGGGSPPQSHIRFGDLGGYGWAAGAIGDLAGRDVIRGVAPGQFDPAAAVTRAQLAALVLRLFHLQPATNPVAFGDVQPGDWFAGPVQAISPYMPAAAPGVFDPQAPATRQVVAATLVQVLVAGGLPLLNPSQTVAVLAAVPDAGSIAPDLAPYVATAYEDGILAGFPDGSLQPGGTLTRAQAAVLLERILSRYLYRVGPRLQAAAPASTASGSAP